MSHYQKFCERHMKPRIVSLSYFSYDWQHSNKVEFCEICLKCINYDSGYYGAHKILDQFNTHSLDKHSTHNMIGEHSELTAAFLIISSECLAQCQEFCHLKSILWMNTRTNAAYSHFRKTKLWTDKAVLPGTEISQQNLYFHIVL